MGCGEGVCGGEEDDKEEGVGVGEEEEGLPKRQRLWTRATVPIK